MPTIKSGQITLSYHREGNGNPILFISGLSANRFEWVSTVSHLKDQFDCITFDNRGNGESSKPSKGYTISDLTDDAVNILNQLSILQAHIVGISMGGLVAQRIALEKPELAKSLVLLASFAKAGPRTTHVWNSRKLMQKGMNRHDYTWALAAWMFGPDSLGQPGFIDNFAKKAADNPNPQPLHAYNELVYTISEFDSRAELHNIQKPTLVMVGEHDILTPPSLSRELADGITGAEFSILPNTGHFCHLERPKEFARRVANFLNKIDT